MVHFREHVASLVGRHIRLGRGGPDERRGNLVAVRDDYLSLLSEDGSLVHYPLHHLRSITEIVAADSEETNLTELSLENIPALPASLMELMTSFTGLKIQVYDHGPETAAGIVFGVGNDFVKLITSPDEMVHYPFFHIRSVRLAKGKGKDNKENGNGNGNGNDNGRDDGRDNGRDRGRSGSGRGKSKNKQKSRNKRS